MRLASIRGALAALASTTAVAATAAELNISQYVFADTDRDGVYDIDEKALAGVEVVLVQFSREPIVHRSNLAGFANFPMSAEPPEDEDDPADITAPGELAFSVKVPSGMEITTGPVAQTTTARALPGSPSGLIVDPPLPFVGLAPTRTIETGGSGVEGVTCTKDGAVVTAERVGDDFVCAAEAGLWTVRWEDGSGESVSRDVVVTDGPVRVPFPVEPPFDPARTGDVVDFEDVMVSENIKEMGAGPGGVRWHNFVATHDKFYGAYGYVNGAVSGEYAAYNSSGHPARIYDDTPFDFIGAYVSVAWPDAMAAPVRIEGYRDGELVGDDTFLASNIRPLWFDARWQGVDEVRFSHDAYWQVVIDDLAIAR